MSAHSQALDALKILAEAHADPKECAKRGHQWVTAEHQVKYLCAQCGTPGFYDFENACVTADEKVAKASMKFKVENPEPVMPVQGQGSLRDFDKRMTPGRPQQAPVGFGK